MSLGLRLTLLNGVVLLLTAGAFAAVVYLWNQQSLERELNTSLSDQARAFNFTSRISFDPFTGRPRVALSDPNVFAASSFFIQVVDRRGEVVARSRNLSTNELPIGPAMLEAALNGQQRYEDVEVDGQPLRLLVTPLEVSINQENQVTVGMIQVARPLEPMYRTLDTLGTTFLGVGAVAVLAALVTGWLLARAALRPIDRLAALAQSIGAAQDFARRMPIGPRDRRDEVGRLAEEFNQMLSRLQASYDQLEQALGAQRRFVADASHELRTPLTSLRGNVDLLRQMQQVALAPAADADEQTQVLADMAAETERMSRLVADLLLLAQADAGQHLELEPTAVAPVVREAFRAARFLREGVSLELGAVPDEAWVQGDAGRLKQLLLILLDNALKYTPAGGQVTLSGESVTRGSERGIVLRVSDTGPGIAPADLAHVFERFYRVDRARSDGGAGLGLAIARWIADEHRGRLDVQSQPGEGSDFSLWLPAVPAPGLPGAPGSVPREAAWGEAAPVQQPLPTPA